MIILLDISFVILFDINFVGWKIFAWNIWMERGYSNSNFRPSLNCIEDIEQAIWKTTAKQDESIKIITDSIETQMQEPQQNRGSYKGINLCINH